MTPEGQSAFMQKVMERITQVPEGRGKGFYYWEPAWIPMPGCGWANEESLNYIQDPGPGGNEWANPFSYTHLRTASLTEPVPVTLQNWWHWLPQAKSWVTAICWICITVISGQIDVYKRQVQGSPNRDSAISSPYFS